jgi:AbrB family looped-hinge helix DNA binding protein
VTDIITSINENGRLVLPASFRKALGIKPGDKVVLRLEDDEVRISSVKRALERARRLVRDHVPVGQSLSEGLIRDRRAASDRE